MDSPQMRQLKEDLRRQGSELAVRDRLRQLDLRLREEYFRRQQFALRGGVLLCGFGGLAMACGLGAASLRRKLPMPAGRPDLTAEQKRLARLGRWAVVGCGIALGGAVLVWAGASQRPMAVLDLREDVAGPRDEEAPGIAPSGDFPTAEELARNWPRFRGPSGAGVSAYANVPATWDGESGLNILWKTPVSLPGENSPVVWGNRVFLTGAKEFVNEVYCWDADTGKSLWEKEVVVSPGPRVVPPDVTEDTGYAAPTAATDGRRVYAMFANGDVAAFDFAGKQAWARNLGKPKSAYGFAASLLTYRGLLLIQFDQGEEEEGISRVLALDGATGRQVWSARRPVANSWATPIVAAAPAGEQLITCSRPWVIAYEPLTGKEIWRVKGVEGDVAPSPIFAGGLVLAISPSMYLLAIQPDGRGDVTKTHLAWKAGDGVPDITSPASDGQTVLLLTSQGTLTCYDLAGGAKLYEQELRASFRSSPSLAGGRVYLLDENGVMQIVAAGRQFKRLGEARLGERSNCSPVFQDGRIYVRGRENLYCIAEKAK